ncbi:MAG TPA: VTT domain-containing protein [Thermoanaerobaculia bacterium]
MEGLFAQIGRHGLLLVFANVFLEQVGVPIPALPTLLVAGALAARGEMGLASILAVALAGSLLADTVWYLLGRKQGHRILKIACRISLSPDSCVRQTETLFERRGKVSLLFAKFIPGYNTLAPPLAGAAGMSLPTFLLWDGLGSLLWNGLGVALGVLFHDAVGKVIDYLERLGFWAILVLGIGLVLFIGFKYWERRRLYKILRLARISIDELQGLIEAGEAPAIVDVRTRMRHLGAPHRIPGAIRMTLEEIDEKLSDLPRDREVILYCT